MTDNARHFTLRPFSRDEDVPVLLALLQAIEAEDQDGEDVSEEGLRKQLAGEDAGTRWVALAPGDPARFIGYGGVWKQPAEQRADVLVAVHPEWRCRGLGSLLLDRVLTRAREAGATAVGTYADARNAGADAFLRARGFAPVAAYTQLRVAGEHEFPAPAWPDGFHARPYAEVNDLATLTRAMNEGYAGFWGHNAVTQEQIASWLPEWSPAGLFLIFDSAAQVVGICRAEINVHLSALRGQPTGYVDAPGVLAPWRERNLYEPLLLTALAWLKPHRPAAIEMESWGDRLETLALYQNIGFAVVRQATSYRQDVR